MGACRPIAGFPRLKLHGLGHTFVTLWVEAGVDAKEVSVRAGHSSVTFTLDRYGHLYEDVEDEMPDSLDALLSRRLASHTRPKTVPETDGRGKVPSELRLWVAPTGFEPVLPP